jgi:hypothetical protein
MGLGSLNPGCNNCRCCDICADFDTAWFFSACQWDGPSGIVSQLNGMVFDLGVMTPELQNWPVATGLVSGDVWYCESRVDIPDVQAVFDRNLRTGQPFFPQYSATVRVDNLRLVIAWYSRDATKCKRNFFGGIEYRLTLEELRDENSDVVTLANVSDYLRGGDPLQRTLTFPEPIRYGYEFHLSDVRCSVRGKNTAADSSPEYRFYIQPQVWHYFIASRPGPGGPLEVPPAYLLPYCNYLSVYTPPVVYSPAPTWRGMLDIEPIRPLYNFSKGMHAQTTAVFISCCPAVGDFEELEASISTTEDLPAVFRQGEETVLPIDLDNVVAGSVIALSLPTGLEWDEEAGEVRGDPTQPPGMYTFYLQGLVDTGPHAGCTVKGTFSVLVTDCPDPTDYDELGATLAPIAAHSTEPRPFSKAGSLGNIARFLCTDCDYDGATVEGLPAGLDARSGTGTWGDANLWFVGTPDSGVTNGLYTITLRTTVTDGDHEGCEIFREYEIEVTD